MRLSTTRSNARCHAAGGEQIRRQILNGRAREPAARSGDRGGRDVEGDRLESALGNELSILAEPAAHDNRACSGGSRAGEVSRTGQTTLLRPLGEEGTRYTTVPGHGGLARLGGRI